MATSQRAAGGRLPWPCQGSSGRWWHHSGCQKGCGAGAGRPSERRGCGAAGGKGVPPPCGGWAWALIQPYRAAGLAAPRPLALREPWGPTAFVRGRKLTSSHCPRGICRRRPSAAGATDFGSVLPRTCAVSTMKQKVADVREGGE